VFQGAYGGVAPDGGKVGKELVQGLAPLQLVQKGLERDTCTPKHRRPPERIGVPDNHSVGGRHRNIFQPKVYSEDRGKTNCRQVAGLNPLCFRAAHPSLVLAGTFQEAGSPSPRFPYR